MMLVFELIRADVVTICFCRSTSRMIKNVQQLILLSVVYIETTNHLIRYYTTAVEEKATRVNSFLMSDNDGVRCACFMLFTRDGGKINKR